MADHNQRSATFRGLIAFGSLAPLLLIASCEQGPKAPATLAGSTVDLVTVSTGATAEAGDDENASAGQILLQVQHQYAGYESFQCQIEATSMVQYPGSAPTSRSSTYTFAWRNDGAFRMESARPTRDRLLFGSNGQTKWELFPFEGLKTDDTISVAEHLAKFQGVSGGTSVLLPSCFPGVEWSRQSLSLPYGKLLEAMATKAVLSDETTIDGHDCYVIVCERDIGTWTFYVDKDSSVLRRLLEIASPAQVAVQRVYGGGGFSGTISSFATDQVFKSIVIDGDLPTSFFDPPAELVR